jgi:drug/metabolite transporter (DMT)-like permease
VPFCLIVWGQTAIGAGLASILNATTPLWTVVVAHVCTADENLAPGRLAGVMLGFAGVAAMIGPEALGGFGKNIVAQLACVAAAISYALPACTAAASSVRASHGCSSPRASSALPAL